MTTERRDEKEWLDSQTNGLRKYIGLLITAYDDGRIDRPSLDARLGIMCRDMGDKVYNHAFTLGIESAELTGDDEFEVEIDFDEERPE